MTSTPCSLEQPLGYLSLLDSHSLLLPVSEGFRDVRQVLHRNGPFPQNRPGLTMKKFHQKVILLVIIVPSRFILKICWDASLSLVPTFLLLWLPIVSLAPFLQWIFEQFALFVPFLLSRFILGKNLLQRRNFV